MTGPSGEPSAAYRYVTVDELGKRTLVERISTDSGIVQRIQHLDDSWALPAVTIMNDASGLSADGKTLALIRPRYNSHSETTRLLILDAIKLRTEEEITLDGRFSFDAISPDGRLLFLVQYADPRDPLDYRVRAYDLAKDRLVPGPIVDPEEPDEQMTGQPVSRRSSPDGRWAYTLYGGSKETFIHALDTRRATAVCVDIEGIDARALYNLDLRVDPQTGVITVLKGGDPFAVVHPRTFEVSPAPRARATEPSGDAPGEDAGGGGIAWVLGVALAAAAAAFAFWRLRRRRDDPVDEQELERLVRIQDGKVAGEESEREPVA